MVSSENEKVGEIWFLDDEEGMCDEKGSFVVRWVWMGEKENKNQRGKWKMDMLLLSKYFVFGYFEIILTIRSISIHKQWRFKNWMTTKSFCTIICDITIMNIRSMRNTYITTTICTIKKLWTLKNITANSIFTCLSLHKSSWWYIMRIFQSENKRLRIIFQFTYWLLSYYNIYFHID